jgi:hypothetical protein
LQQHRWDKVAAKRRYESQLRKREVWGKEFITCKVPPLASREKISFLRSIVKTRRAKPRLPVLVSVSRRMGFRKKRRRHSCHGVELHWSTGSQKELRDLPMRYAQSRLDGKYQATVVRLPSWLERADQ